MIWWLGRWSSLERTKVRVEGGKQTGLSLEAEGQVWGLLWRCQTFYLPINHSFQRRVSTGQDRPAGQHYAQTHSPAHTYCFCSIFVTVLWVYYSISKHCIRASIVVFSALMVFKTQPFFHVFTMDRFRK